MRFKPFFSFLISSVFLASAACLAEVKSVPNISAPKPEIHWKSQCTHCHQKDTFSRKALQNLGVPSETIEKLSKTHKITN